MTSQARLVGGRYEEGEPLGRGGMADVRKGIDNLAYGVREQVPKGVRFVQADISSKDIYPHFKDAGAVFHLAAKNCIADCQADPVETSDVNVTGTVNVLEACRRAGVMRVVQIVVLAKKTERGWVRVTPTSQCTAVFFTFDDA